MIDRLAIPLPWLDRAGRLSWLKLAVFAGCVAPALYLAAAYRLDALGAKPITALIHATGEWAVRILLFCLAISPLRRIADWPKVLVVRRMLGVAVMAYAVAHLTLYAVDQNLILTKVASEIALRLYLTIGFVALIGLIALGLTSTDAAIRNLGPNWHRLHRLVYTIAVLALAHYFLQSKIDVTDPVFSAGLFLLLMGWRVMRRFKWPERPWSLLLLALLAGLVTAGLEAAWYGLASGVPASLVLAALATAGLEAAWYGLASGVPANLVLAANLDFSGPIRPAWWVLAVGLSLPAMALVRGKRARTVRPPAGGRTVSPVRRAASKEALPEPLSPRA